MSSYFTTQLRARPGLLQLSDDTASAMMLRVQVAEAWDAVRVQAAPNTSIAELKQAALNTLMPDANDPESYETKFRGELVDDRTTLHSAGVPDGATLLVIGRRKRPVR